MTKPWIFMGVDRSHFSAKLRPVLRYKQLHYVEYPPDMARITARTGTGFVPVLFTPEDEALQDTTDIIDVLEAREPTPGIIPDQAMDRILCRLFELYADEFFPMVSMRTRWAYEENEQELRRAFASFTGAVEAGNKTADLMSSYLPMLGITKDTIPAIDAHTTDMLSALNLHFQSHNFILGDRLSLADCALMGPLYAHLYLDRVTRQQLYQDFIHVCMWIERCNHPVPEAMGDWFAGCYPASLQTVLKLLGADMAPMMLDQYKAFKSWADEQHDFAGELPRGVGQYHSTLRNVPVTAGVRSYVIWKMQRLQACYEQCCKEGSKDERSQIETTLQACGCLPLVQACGVPALTKTDFKLTFA
jgi:glutathione S-transferase